MTQRMPKMSKSMPINEYNDPRDIWPHFRVIFLGFLEKRIGNLLKNGSKRIEKSAEKRRKTDGNRIEKRRTKR